MGVSYNGYSQASAVSGTNGVFLDFGTQGLNSSRTNNRAFGFQLRCLSE